MPTIFALCGSLRANSSNGKLLRAAAEMLPKGVRADFYDGLEFLPAFDPGHDIDAPPLVQDLRRRVAAASAVLIATPEYAHGVPGALKNALDWMVGSGELVDKPVAVVLASSTDGAFARKALVEVLRTMSAKVPDELVLAAAGVRTKAGTGGKLDPGLQDDLRKLMSQLAQSL